jgi:PAS domain S-box-containing protein
MPYDGFTGRSFPKFDLSQTDIVKIWVIASFFMVSILVTFYAMTVPVTATTPTLLFLFPQLYYIPIILVSIWYPRYGLQCTVLLVAAFLAITAYFSYLGTVVDPFVSGLNAAMYLWVVAATTFLAKEGGVLNIKYWNVFRNAEAGLFLCDRTTGTILEANEKLAGIIGYRAEELKGLPARELWEDTNRGEEIIRQCSQDMVVSEQKMKFLAKSGDVRTVLVSCKNNPEHPLIECTVVDISNMEQEEERLVRAKDHLIRFLGSSQDLIFMHDPSGRFLQFHWAKAEEYGIEPVRMIGRTPYDLFGKQAADCIVSHLKDVIETGETCNFTISATIGGRDLTFSTLLGPVADETAKTIGAVGTMRDITGLQPDEHSTVELERELDRWRNFINTAAHELRTPLQPILGYLHLILEDPSSYALDSETVKLLQLCLENVERERRVVDRMLELGIMDSCAVRLNVSEILLRQLINTVIRIGGHDLQAQILVSVPHDTTILADRDRIYQVLDGVIQNAIQYSDPPRMVWISYEETEEHHCITIRDNGMGIASDSCSAIFEPFYLADSDNLSREYGRIGLGLSIAQKYVKMHRGDILVESEMGTGSTFTVRLSKEVDEV